MAFGILGVRSSVPQVDLCWLGWPCLSMGFGCTLPGVWPKPAHPQLMCGSPVCVKVLAHEKLESSELELWVLGHCSRSP